MTRPGPRKPPPRAASLVKAAQRRTQADAAATRAPAQAALAARAKVDFLDPLMRHAAMRAKGIGLCAYLVTLAAFQRGLKVSFHYELASFDARFAGAKLQGHRGELFSLSDGRRTHVFSRTMGDRTATLSSALAEDKHLTRRALAQAGVPTPAGIVVERGQAALIGKFVARDPAGRYVVKPLTESLSRNVHADLPGDAVVAAARAMSAARILVEEHLRGTECRATVVDGRCVAVSRRLMPVVTGDGAQSIEGLIARLNEVWAANPFTEPIACTDAVKGFLARQGLTPASVPAVGRRVQLMNTSYGVEHEDVTDSVDEAVKAQAARAAQALGLPNCGVDLIVTAPGRAFVLEVNQRSYIGMHSFPQHGPGQGNAVAEAIVDGYFPDSAGRRVHPALAYDFAAVRAALESGQVAEVTLPVVGPEWKVVRLTETGMAARVGAELLRTAAQATGVHVMGAPLEKGGWALCLAGAPANWRALLGMLPAPWRGRFEALDVAG